MATKWMARKRAQRAIPNLKNMKCLMCATSKNLERHHPNYEEPNRVEILCASCHIKADQRDGTRRIKQEKACNICGKMFLSSHTKKHNTCSRECLTEIGRINAFKRWHPSGPASQPIHHELQQA